MKTVEHWIHLPGAPCRDQAHGRPQRTWVALPGHPAPLLGPTGPPASAFARGCCISCALKHAELPSGGPRPPCCSLTWTGCVHCCQPSVEAVFNLALDEALIFAFLQIALRFPPNFNPLSPSLLWYPPLDRRPHFLGLSYVPSPESLRHRGSRLNTCMLALRTSLPCLSSAPDAALAPGRGKPGEAGGVSLMLPMSEGGAGQAGTTTTPP